MQSRVGDHSPKDALAKYRKRTGADPFVYSIDLAGYGTLQFPEPKVATLAGFSDKLFDTMRMAEENPQGLIDRIKAIEL